MPFTILQDDLTRQKVDAIVNAANTELRQGGGVCGAIFKAAGEADMAAACAPLAPIETGDAVMTPGFALSARYVIHAAGPIYRDGRSGEAALLRQTYGSALHLADSHRLESIAFPLISAGIYGYPKAEALAIATGSIRAFLEKHEMDIRLVIFDRAAFELSRELTGAVESYLEQHFADRTRDDIRLRELQTISMESAYPANVPAQLEREVQDLNDSFAVRLFQLIDEKGMSDVSVYKRANLDRRLFSKIRSDKHYSPGKRTAVALTIALELTLGETDDLLARAGYALSTSRIDDVIVRYFIENKMYDIFSLNEVLFAYGRPLLGT
ncbi:MAG TPA: RNase III inhibitor [Clostridiaceae bacterium]|nr:RNase III inhibitor [Clostridiaceae bacterium]